MGSECDRCGQEDPDCHCELYELRNRVDKLEEVIGKLAFVVFELEADIKTLQENAPTCRVQRQVVPSQGQTLI